MRITAYADRLLDDLDALDWPEAIKLQQRNWIGRSEGARVDFPLDGDDAITVFTTRPDTLFGATYMVLAPEHPLVDKFIPAAWPEGTHDVWTGGHATPAEAVTAYRKQAASKSDVERQAEAKDKTGVFTGAYATNPVNGERIPVFIADYVLMGYGTGAIMAVPAQRPARLRVRARLRAADRCIVEPTDGRGTDTSTWEDAFGVVRREDHQLHRRGHLAGRPGRRRGQGAHHRVAGRSAASARAPSTSGCATGCSAASATGASPSRSSTTRTASPTRCPSRCCRWSCRRSRTTRRAPSSRTTPTPSPRRRCRATRTGSNVTLDLGDGRGPRAYRRETNTMPNWAGSCWYELRYLDPHNYREAGRPGDRAVLDGPARGPAARRRRPVRRRRRARRAAPAVRALLVQGAVRPGARLLGRAVPQAVQPGHDPGLRLPRQPRLRRCRPPRSRSATARSSTRARRSSASWARWASP